MPRDNKLHENDSEIHDLKEALFCLSDKNVKTVPANKLNQTEQALPPQSCEHDSEHGPIDNSTNRIDKSSKDMRRAERKKQKERKKKKHIQCASTENTDTQCQNSDCAMLLYHTVSQCKISNQQCAGA